ncbi:MAG: hypothetical protein QM760_15910 [Nibricoccus sp.]
MSDLFYPELPLWAKYITGFFGVGQLAVVFLRSLKETLLPARARKGEDEIIKDYLSEPSYDGGPLERHLVEWRAAATFKSLTGITCKKPLRDALIELHETKPWGWAYLRSIMPHLAYQDGALKYRVGWLDRIAQAFFYSGATFFALLLLILVFLPGAKSTHKDILIFFGLAACFTALIVYFLLQALPLERARYVKKVLSLEPLQEELPVPPKSARNEHTQERPAPNAQLAAKAQTKTAA